MSRNDWVAGNRTLEDLHCAACGWTGYLPREACPQCHHLTVRPEESAMEGLCVAVTRISAAYSPAGVDTMLALISINDGTTVLIQCDAQVEVTNRVSIDFRENGIGRRLVPVAYLAEPHHRGTGICGRNLMATKEMQ